MSISAERLLALRRQAGADANANLPRPLFFKKGRQAQSAASIDGNPARARAGGEGPEVAGIGASIDGYAANADQDAPSTRRIASPDRAAVAGILSTPLPRRSPLVEKEGPGEICPSPTDGPPRAVDTIAALRRLLDVRGRTLAPPADRASRSLPSTAPLDRSLPGDEIASGLRLIETWQKIAAPPAAWPLAFARRDDTVDPHAVMFFDTETTGLAGGTGTRAFMVGAAELHHDARHGDRLRIRQLLITTMAAERAMLAVFASWLQPTTVLSSYNGRCYDAPLLKTRYRLARMADPLSALDHVDLLFPSRRRWRGRWENCRLATIEREALGIVREDDLPGAQAPAAWLRYLRGGSASLLRRVAAHNHQDVVTLALLMARLVALHGDDAAGAAAPEAAA